MGEKMEKDGSVLPPSYDAVSTSPPDLTAAFSSLRLGPSGSKPTADQCIAHLKMLEAFSQLREEVSTTDGLYGLKDSLVPFTNDEQKMSQSLAKVREKRWAVYVTIAAQRFIRYWDITQPGSVMLTQARTQSPMYANVTDQGSPINFTQDNLPPLGEPHLMQAVSPFANRNKMY